MEALTLKLQFELQKLITRARQDQHGQLKCLITKLLKQELTVIGFQREVCNLFGMQTPLCDPSEFSSTPFDKVWLELELVLSILHLEKHFGKKMSIKGWRDAINQDQVVPVHFVPVQVVGTSAGR
jgi:hypothetical protein